jgi:AcrR family transcriptional regulator
VAEAGVAKMSLYRHFPSKEGLALAVMDLRRERWTRDWLHASVERLASSPQERLLAYFDAFDEWFNGDYEGCTFIDTLLETTGADLTHAASVRELELIRLIIEDDAREAEILEPEALSYQLQILLMGAIVSARRGDLDAARRARQVAAVLIDGMQRGETAAAG